MAALHVRVGPPSRGGFVIAAGATDMHGVVQPKERARNAVTVE